MKKFILKKIKKIYQLIRIYFKDDFYLNIICNKGDSKDNILFKIRNSPLIANFVMTNLNINQYSLNNCIIIEKLFLLDNFDKVYELVLNNFNNINDTTKIESEMNIPSNNNSTTRMVISDFDKIKDYSNTNIDFTNEFNDNHNLILQQIKNNQLIHEQIIKTNQMMLENMKYINQMFQNNFQMNNNPLSNNMQQNIWNNNLSFNNQNFQNNNY